MENTEFITFRGKLLEAKVIWLGNQKIVQAAIPSDRIDSATFDVYAQQKIDIVPGLKICHKKTGKELEILSHSDGYFRHVTVRDSRRSTMNPVNITESEIRENYRFVG